MRSHPGAESQLCTTSRHLASAGSFASARLDGHRLRTPLGLSQFCLDRCLLHQTCEKRCHVAGEGHWFFCGREMPTAFHGCPPLDVIEALSPLPRRISFEGVLRGEVGDGSGRADEVFRSKRNPVPAVIEIVAHGTRNGSSDPVQSQERQQKITRNAPFEVAMTVTPGL